MAALNLVEYDDAPAEVRAAGSLAVEIGVALAVTGGLELIFDVLVEARDDA